jgi:hypothetical protein
MNLIFCFLAKQSDFTYHLISQIEKHFPKDKYKAYGWYKEENQNIMRQIEG